MVRRVLVVGEGTGPAARSVRRAGGEPVCLEVGDWQMCDALAGAREGQADQPLLVGRVLNAMRRLAVPSDVPVLWVQPLENYVGVLEAIAFERPLVGSSPQAVRGVRDPLALSSLPPHKGLRYPKVRSGASLMTRAGQMLTALLGGKGYLVKPREGYGGRGVSFWTAPQRVGRDAYLQQYIKGMPMSAVYVADGWSAHLIGATEHIIGDPAFGADGFRYVGNIGPVQPGDTLRQALMHLGVVLTQRFDLRGVFGVDGVMDFAGNFWPVEVNPRYTNSVEVLERATGISVLESVLGLSDSATRKARTVPQGATSVCGQAYVCATSRVTVSAAMAEMGTFVVDVAPPGTVVEVGEPICTVQAEGRTRDACMAELRRMAEEVRGVMRGEGG